VPNSAKQLCREIQLNRIAFFASPNYYLFIIYLLRPKAAQHNITTTKTEETHKKLKSKIHKN